MKVEKQIWEKKQEKWVRDGWQRYTTYIRKEYLASLQTYAKKHNLHVLDLIDEAVTKWLRNK